MELTSIAKPQPVFTDRKYYWTPLLENFLKEEANPTDEQKGRLFYRFLIAYFVYKKPSVMEKSLLQGMGCF